MTLVRPTSVFVQPPTFNNFNFSSQLIILTFTHIFSTHITAYPKQHQDRIIMELSSEPVPSEEYGSALDACMTEEERVHVRREGWAYFDRIYGVDEDEEGNPLTQEAKYERLDRYPSPDYRYDTWYTPEYEFRRRAQNAPLSPPKTPPHIPQQHTRRKTSNRIEKSRKSQPSASVQKELRRQKKKAPRRPLTRSLDEGHFQEIELDPRPGKLRYWNIREGCPRGWSFYALTYTDYLERWVSGPKPTRFNVTSMADHHLHCSTMIGLRPCTTRTADPSTQSLELKQHSSHGSETWAPQGHAPQKYLIWSLSFGTSMPFIRGIPLQLVCFEKLVCAGVLDGRSLPCRGTATSAMRGLVWRDSERRLPSFFDA